MQISVIGVFIILVFYALAAGTLALLWKGLASRRGRREIIGGLAVAALALPWVDEVWIAWRFSELCKEAGVHVTRKVDVDGFLEDTSRSAGHVNEQLIVDPQAIKDFDRAGYRFRESMLYSGKVFHLERVESGLQITVLERPVSRYVYKYADPRQEVPIGLKLEKRETIVVDSQTGEVIARETSFNRYPGWVEGLWIRFLGSGQTICPDPGKGPPREHLPGSALRPSNKR